MKEFLKQFISSKSPTMIVLDTCSCANTAFPALLHAIEEIEMESRFSTRLLIPARVYRRELPKLADDTSKPDASAAAAALMMLQEAEKKCTAMIYPDILWAENADACIAEMVLALIRCYNFVVITQDRGLMNGIQAMAETRPNAMNGNQICVMRLDAGSNRLMATQLAVPGARRAGQRPQRARRATCRNCGREFVITADQLSQHLSGVPLPTHCPCCRAGRKRPSPVTTYDFAPL